MLPVITTRGFMPNWIEEFFGNDVVKNFDDQFVNSSMPSVNVTEQEKCYIVEVAAPGLKKEEFKVELDNKLLKISSEKKHEEEKKDEKILRREFNYCSFKRTFSLPETVDSEKIEAKHENGILSVVIPKKDEAIIKPNKAIEIK